MARKKGNGAGAWGGKGGLHSEGRRSTGFQGRKGGQVRRVFLVEIGESINEYEWMQKLSMKICRVLVSLQVWPNLKWERRLGDEKPGHKMKKRNESG